MEEINLNAKTASAQLRELVNPEISEKLTEAQEITEIPISDHILEATADKLRLDFKNTRLPIARASKSLQAHAKEFINSVKGAEAEILAPIASEEKRLQGLLDANKAERKRIEEEKERQLIARFNDRTKWLFSLNAAFDGESYQIGKLKVSTQRITEASPDDWAGITEKLKAEAERLLAEERQRQADLEAARAEAEKLRKELEAMKAAKAEAETPNPEPMATVKAEQTPEPVKIAEPLTKVLEEIKPEPTAADRVGAEPIKTVKAEPKPYQVETRTPEFLAGFNHAKTNILAILESNNFKSDGEKISAIKNLLP